MAKTQTHTRIRQTLRRAQTANKINCMKTFTPNTQLHDRSFSWLGTST